MALEQAGVFRGLYHVLLGRIAPLEGIGPDQLTIASLVERIRNGNFTEVIMGTNPTLEGDGTALYIANQLAGSPTPITRLARGITTGSVLEFANKEILSDRAMRRFGRRRNSDKFETDQTKPDPCPCDSPSDKNCGSFKSRCWRRA